jgi:hypothetical protein
MLTHTISVEVASYLVSNAYAEEHAEHVDCTSARLLLRSLDGVRNMVFVWTNTGIVNRSPFVDSVDSVVYLSTNKSLETPLFCIT